MTQQSPASAMSSRSNYNQSLSFHNWFDALMQVLGCTNVDVAQLGGIDPSLVSRFRRGQRRPAANLKQLKRLIDGVFAAAEQQHALETLQSFLAEHTFGEPDVSIASEIASHIEPDRSSLYQTLFAQAVHVLRYSPNPRMSVADELTTPSCIPARLSQLMQLVSVTNSRLAHELKVDNSLVSRWRSGARPLRADNPVLDRLTDYFANLIVGQAADGNETLVQNLHQLLQTEDGTIQLIPETMLTLEADSLAALLRQWLLSDLTPADNGKQRIRRLLEKLDSWQGVPHFQGDFPLEVANVPSIAQKNSYQGVSGIREAVIRFLSDVALSSQQRHIKLFSNQVIDWLVGDPTFLRVWSCLMYLVLVRGHKIEIIHHLGRSDAEIGLAIENWLP
ncbi:MAG TPA: hypothetical protein GX717_09900, partial [Clostridiaceae bacterium]|nr:hypothetical protein [Clostridiaceae bacterium]